MTRAHERIRLPDSTIGPLRAGHPWVYRDVKVSSRPGEIVRLLDGRDRLVGWGLADEGPIAVRVMGLGEPEPLADVIRGRIQRADALRARLVEPDTDCWRVVHGEGDQLPGLVVDRYGAVVVIRLYASAWVPHLPTLVEAVRSLGYATWILRRLGVERVDGERGVVSLIGGDPPPRVVVREAGMRLLVDVIDGQKTGMFLDQRTHRALVRRWADGRTAANLFSYTGGFSVAAALGGATRVATVDVAPAAVEAAKENFRLNGIDPDRHVFEVADAFTWTPPRPVDLLVVDPPSLARDRKAADAARAAYRKLHKGLAGAVARDGLLVTSSCTAQVDELTWRRAVEEGLAGSGFWAWLWTSGSPPDHPVAVGHPEGRYLKFGALRRG